MYINLNLDFEKSAFQHNNRHHETMTMEDESISYLPELGTNLVTALTDLKMDDFSHGGR
jgi:hypothetical protein